MKIIDDIHIASEEQDEPMIGIVLEREPQFQPRITDFIGLLLILIGFIALVLGTAGR